MRYYSEFTASGKIPGYVCVQVHGVEFIVKGTIESTWFAFRAPDAFVSLTPTGPNLLPMLSDGTIDAIRSDIKKNLKWIYHKVESTERLYLDGEAILFDDLMDLYSEAQDADAENREVGTMTTVADWMGELHSDGRLQYDDEFERLI